MKKLFLSAAAAAALVCLGGPALAQPLPVAPDGGMTLGGVPQLLAQKLQEAKAAGIVDFAGHVGGGAYVPTYVFHDVVGVNYVEVGDIGYRALQGAKPSVFFMPFAVNLTGVSARLWEFSWADAHVTRSPYPDIFLGLGPLLPTDRQQLQALRLDRPKEWLAASASVRFK